ncbi:MAG: nucleoside triphosphate pyrophosphohydrolase [candidate division WOR-3 bacterium]
MSKKNSKNCLDHLLQIVRTLREKCPWDRKQTLNSLKNNLIEETYEVVTAIENNDQQGIAEEIGDLLFLSLFLSLIFEEKSGVPIHELVLQTVAKYKEKHPHVFKEKTFKNSDEIVKFWHSKKKDLFKGIPYALPALIAARVIQERASKFGFDWPDEKGPFKKIDEELRELKKSASKRQKVNELGDLLFSCVNLARHLGVDPEEALRKANKKFVKRFRVIQKIIIKEQRNLNLEEMDRIWNRIKKSKF